MAEERDMWDAVEGMYAKCGPFGGFAHGEERWEEVCGSFLERVPLKVLLGFLRKASEEGDLGKLDVVCAVFKGLSQSKVGSSQLASSDFVPHLLDGMRHYSEEVRRLSVEQAKKSGSIPSPAVHVEEITKVLCRCLRDKDTGVAHIASDALFAYSKVSRAMVLSAIQETSREPPQGNMGDPSETELRRLHLIARVASRDDKAFEECRSLGLLGPFLDVVQGNDVLLQLNALKLVPLLAATQTGLKYLFDSSVVPTLQRMAGLDERSEPDPSLEVEAMRVLAFLSARENTSGISLDLGKIFLEGMKSRLARTSMSDPNASIPLLEMLGAFAGSQPPDSLNLILGQEQEVLRPWMQFAVSQGDLVKTAGLSSLAAGLRGGAITPHHSQPLHDVVDDVVEFSQLVEQGKTKDVDPAHRKAAATAGRELFLAYGRALHETKQMRNFKGAIPSPEDIVRQLVEYTKHPLDDVRCGVYVVLRMLASQDNVWGLEALFAAGQEVVQTLYDRSLKMSKSAMEWRFAMFESMYHNAHMKTVLGPKQQEKLLHFLKRGPYLGPDVGSSPPQVEVALQDAAA